jgi:hypothetical protein
MRISVVSFDEFYLAANDIHTINLETAQLVQHPAHSIISAMLEVMPLVIVGIQCLDISQ